MTLRDEPISQRYYSNFRLIQLDLKGKFNIAEF